MRNQSQAAKQAILDVVANQLKDENPPETQQTYKRLVAQLSKLPPETFDD